MADSLQRTSLATFAAAAEGIPAVRSSVVLFFKPAQPRWHSDPDLHS